MKLAVVGATGLVGRELIKVLEEHKISPTLFIPVASPGSYGKSVELNGTGYSVKGPAEAIDLHPQVAIFSAGGAVSREWAPKFAESGITVIDNSSAWRMEPDIPLIVPEINADILTRKDKIIANPNCSTIQMVMVLAPLHRKYRVKRVVVSTYQSVTGTGAKAVKQLENERKGIRGELAYPHPIDLNLFPHGGFFLEDGSTSEELKLLKETQKILRDNTIQVTSTVVRVPVTGGHSEAVNIEFENEFDLKDIFSLLKATGGVTVMDDPANAVYPTPLSAQGKDDVFVGRIRRDYSVPNALNLFIVSDNLRKGAATNAIQIANYLIANNLI